MLQEGKSIIHFELHADIACVFLIKFHLIHKT